MVVKQPKFTRVEEPTLLCNQVEASTSNGQARFRLMVWVAQATTFAQGLSVHQPQRELAQLSSTS
jgi:hypothetical protein